MAKSKMRKSGLLLAGAALGVAVAWLSRRRSSLATIPERALQLEDEQPLVDASSAELPLGRSADANIDQQLSRSHLPQNDTSGASLLGDAPPESAPPESLEELSRAMPDLAEPDQSDGYDATAPEDLGTVWLERASETEPDPRTPPFESGIPPELEGMLISESSINAAHALEQLEDSDDLDAELDGLERREGDDGKRSKSSRGARSSKGR